MTNRERERLTIDFGKPDRGAIEETFFPWLLTVDRFREEGLPDDIADCGKGIIADPKTDRDETYLRAAWGEGIYRYDQYFGFDPVKRIEFILPFRRFEEKVIEETDAHKIISDNTGRQLIRKKNSNIWLPHKYIVETADDWARLKEYAMAVAEQWYTDEAIQRIFGPLKEGHDRGDYSIRLALEGFFWTPRELMGDEEELIAFIDEPELIHDINEYILEVYQTSLMKVIDLLQPDIVYLMEDLSGKTGPMISGEMFDEFVGHYYRQLVPMLKEHGVGNVLVDTDGDFMMMIQHFLDAGIDGFIPLDVNAGMDIVKVREQFPNVKLIGGYNKLKIEKGPEAVDREFERILPVVRQGGYIVGADHQVPPSASLENYKYYIRRLREVMEQCGADR